MSRALLDMLTELRQSFVEDAIGNARTLNHHYAAHAVGGLDAVDLILQWLAGVEPVKPVETESDDFVDPAERHL